MRPPFSYYGGKQYMVDWFMEYMPKHKCYVEVFGGSGALLFAKPRSEVEVYNDIDKAVVTFFRVLRDEEKRSKLIEKLLLTPYSRAEHDEIGRDVVVDDDIETARRFFVAVVQSFSSIVGRNFRTARNISMPMQWMNKIDRLDEVACRLMGVYIENLDFADVIKKYDGEDTFFYLDPPYVASSRVTADSYRNEMSLRQHMKMINLVKKVKGKVMISGYHNQLYDEYLSGWYVQEKEFSIMASITEEARNALEVIWMNYDIEEVGRFVPRGLERWLE